MGRQGIKGPAVAFADQLKIALAGLEKDIYLPHANILEMPIFGSQNIDSKAMVIIIGIS